MNLSDNPEAAAQAEWLLWNWGMWSTQGLGEFIPARNPRMQAVFRALHKPRPAKAVNEAAAMNADRCIAKMEQGSAPREILYAVYYLRMDPQQIEAELKIDQTEQDRRVQVAQQQFWDLWTHHVANPTKGTVHSCNSMI